MPLDVPPKKDVPKEGDKPQEHGVDAQQSRLLLSLEASKKPEHKPEQKANLSASDESMAAYISSGIDKASSLLTDAVKMLPTLTIDDKAKAASTEKVDISSFLKESCNSDAKNEACKATAVQPSLPGFVFKDKALTENTKSSGILTLPETELSTADWNKVFAVYETQKNPGKASQTERTDAGIVHRDATGKVDVVRTATSNILRTSEGGFLNVGDAGAKIKTDKDGNFESGVDKNGNFTLALDNGNRVVIEKGTGYSYLTNKDGVLLSKIYNKENGAFKVVNNYNAGQLQVTNAEMHTKDGLAKVKDDSIAEAIRTGKTVVTRGDGGIVAAAPDKTWVALQNDGSAIVSMPEDKYLVRSKDGELSIYSKDGTSQKISKEFLASIRESKQEEMKALREAAEKLRQFSITNTLHAADGKATLSLAANGTAATIGQDAHLTTVNGVTTVTDHSTGQKEVIDTVNKTVSDDATGSIIEAKPDGQFRVQTKNYTYDSGTVTTKDGDVYSADHVRLANGTEVDRNNTVTLADGTTIRADGSYTSQGRSKAEMVSATIAAESKAASMAGYAEGMAGAIRSRAASGHATASDIASLESVFAGLCDAVASLGMVGDSSVSFKLYSAKGTVSESISTSLANLNSSKAA